MSSIQADTTGVVLESIRRIRAYPYDVPLRFHRRTGFPKGYLRWLLNTFVVDSLGLYLFSKRGDVFLADTYGDKKTLVKLANKIDAPTFRRILREKSSEPAFFISELSNGSRLQEGLDRAFAYVVMHKTAGFTDIESAALTEIMHFVGDYLLHSTRIFVLTRNVEIQRGLVETANRSWKAGSKVVTSIQRIHRNLGASCSYFGIIHNELFYSEYVEKPWHTRPAVASSLSGVPLNKGFYARCSEGRAFIWPRKSPEFPLENLVDIDSLLPSHVNYFFLIGPVVWDGEPIALFVYLISSTTTYFDKTSSHELIEFQTQLFADSVKILFQRRSRAMIVEPLFKARNTIVDPTKVFVLMPFKDPWSDRIWQKLIKPICAGMGLVPLRADDLFGRDIMEDIWQGLCTARLVIADITGRNANVFYELGVAHTLGKDVILLTQNVDDIPFDLNRYRHIIYQDNLDGYEILRNELKGSIETLLAP